MSEPLPEKCCGRCKHYAKRVDAHPGECVVIRPFCVTRFATDGQSCPAFVAKDGET